MTRLALARNAPQHIAHYAEQTRRVVEDIAAELQVLFERRAGRADEPDVSAHEEPARTRNRTNP